MLLERGHYTSIETTVVECVNKKLRLGYGPYEGWLSELQDLRPS